MDVRRNLAVGQCDQLLSGSTGPKSNQEFAVPTELSSPRLLPIIRLFVSSTFSDMKHERNALQRKVFPKLEQLCSQQGFQFQAIDLR